jgi:hypothetical protein
MENIIEQKGSEQQAVEGLSSSIRSERCIPLRQALISYYIYKMTYEATRSRPSVQLERWFMVAGKACAGGNRDEFYI